MSDRDAITAVVAATPSGLIGRDGGMPWRLSTDLRRFKRLTMGGTLLMGRKTFESIGRPLPGRRTCVLTRQNDWEFPGIDQVRSVEEAIAHLKDHHPAFIVGGAQIYQSLWHVVETVYLTRVLAELTGDTYLTDCSLDAFRLESSEEVPAGGQDEFPTRFEVWRRDLQSASNDNR